jgi:hypothetical protein
MGLRAHSGWAALVVVADGGAAPEVVDRRRIEMTDPRLAGAAQPYHALEDLALPKAPARLERFVASARERALRGLREALDDLGRKGYRPAGTGLLLAAGRALPRLEAILASHALIHTADGEHFREALAAASEECGVAVTRVRERDLSSRAEAALGKSAPQIEATVAGLGRALGPPWTQDQKRAALVAWLVLGKADRG